MTAKTRQGSTGSRETDARATGQHVVLLKAGTGVPLEEIVIPGTTPQQRIVVDGRSYEHVADDATTGRWIYR